MTSMAFMLGVLPLAIASGAGSASQRAIGTGVIGGSMMGTILAVFFVPIFFVVVRASSRAASASGSLMCSTPTRSEWTAMNKSMHIKTPRPVSSGPGALPAAGRLQVAASPDLRAPGQRPWHPHFDNKLSRCNGNRHRAADLDWQHFLPGCPAESTDGPVAGKQPRPANGGAEHRAGTRAMQRAPADQLPTVNAGINGSRGPAASGAITSPTPRA
jgi:hypothetical protein